MPDSARSIAVHVRLSPQAYAVLKAQAGAEGRPIGNLMAHLLTKAAMEQQALRSATKKGTTS